MPSEFVSIQPGELKFPFEVGKQLSCSLQLSNNTDEAVAFKVKTTAPKKYCVRPNTGLVLPKSSCDVTVTMQAQREAPADMQCKDKFLVQSVIAPEGVVEGDINPDLFNREPGRDVSETKLRVVYVQPTPPPLPVSDEQPVAGNTTPNNNNSFYDSTRDTSDLKSKWQEVQAQMAKLNEEKQAALQKTQQLQSELAQLAAKSSQTTMQSYPSTGFSFLFVFAVGLLGVIVGYLLKSKN